MLVIFYRMLNIVKNRESFLYRYLYKILKVTLNVFFPIVYKRKNPIVGKKIEQNVVVSFTTFPARIDTVWETAFTLLNQTVRANHVILWLADTQFTSFEALPESLKRLTNYGLEIRFCNDLKSHKKYYYAMKEYPDDIVVIADDDVFYPVDWLEGLLKTHIRNLEAVCCYWAHKITVDDKGNIKSYGEWDKAVKDEADEPSNTLLPVGYGGVLYPPHTLDTRAFSVNNIKELCISADDLWLKAMSCLNGKKAIMVNKNPIRMFALIDAQRTSLYQVNVGENKNDEALRNILRMYPELGRMVEE